MQVMRAILILMVRLVLLLAGLVFALSLLGVALLLLLVWLVRALWAKLTGQPVRSWAFRVNRQAMWSRFYRAPRSGNSHHAGHTPRRDDSNVIDVEPKEIKAPER